RELAALATGAFAAMDAKLQQLALNEALEELWKVIRRGNKYLDQAEPWALARDPAQAPRLARVLYTVAEALRLVALLVAPFLPQTGERIWHQLGLSGSVHQARQDQLRWGLLPAGPGGSAAGPGPSSRPAKTSSGGGSSRRGRWCRSRSPSAPGWSGRRRRSRRLSRRPPPPRRRRRRRPLPPKRSRRSPSTSSPGWICAWPGWWRRSPSRERTASSSSSSTWARRPGRWWRASPRATSPKSWWAARWWWWPT